MGAACSGKEDHPPVLEDIGQAKKELGPLMKKVS